MDIRKIVFAGDKAHTGFFKACHVELRVFGKLGAVFFVARRDRDAVFQKKIDERNVADADADDRRGFAV